MITKLVAPIILLIAIIFFLYKNTKIYRNLYRKIYIFSYRFAIKSTKYLLIIFSFIKLSISLYIVSMMINSNPFYASLITVFLILGISSIIYVLWIIKPIIQKKILFYIGFYFFNSIILILISLFCIYFVVFFSNIYYSYNDFFIALFEIMKNMKFNFINAFFSSILMIFLLNYSYNFFQKCDLDDSSFIKKTENIFFYLRSMPRIFYGLNCYFLNNILNKKNNFLILMLICSFHFLVYYYIKYINQYFNKKLKKISFLNILYEFLHESIILIPVFIINKNLDNEFFSNFIMRIYNIMTNKMSYNSNILYIALSGFIFFILFLYNIKNKYHYREDS